MFVLKRPASGQHKGRLALVCGSTAVPLDSHHVAAASTVVFDAYGTLFDVHSAVARHAAAVGPDAARLSEIWRTKQLEYSWVLSLAGRYEPFWTLTERALDHAFAR